MNDETVTYQEVLDEHRAKYQKVKQANKEQHQIIMYLTDKVKQFQARVADLNEQKEKLIIRSNKLAMEVKDGKRKEMALAEELRNA